MGDVSHYVVNGAVSAVNGSDVGDYASGGPGAGVVYNTVPYSAEGDGTGANGLSQTPNMSDAVDHSNFGYSV